MWRSTQYTFDNAVENLLQEALFPLREQHEKKRRMNKK
jgi:hypothetical protein